MRYGRRCALVRATRRRVVRGGFTILELLVVVAIIAILMALILPAVGSAREAARRIECTNHLKQIGLALHNYHDLHSSLPLGWRWESSARSAYGWGTATLPFLDQRPLYESIDASSSLGNARNDQPRHMSVPIFTCPSDVTTPSFLLMRELADGSGEPLMELPSASYAGVFGTGEPDDHRPTPPGDGSFMDSRSIGFHEFTNGLSNTIIVGERSASKMPISWLGFDADGEDAECLLVGTAKVGPNCQECDECEFSSRHPGISQFLWGDGHVQSVSDSIDSQVYQNMARRHGP